MPGAAYTNSCALAGRLSATGYMDIAALLLPAATYSAVSAERMPMSEACAG